MSIHLNTIKNRKSAWFCAGASATGLILGMLAAGPALAQSTGVVVPWLNQPAAAPASTVAASTPAQQPCATSDLQIVLGKQGVYHGYGTQEILVTNQGANSCYMTGFPSTQLVSPSAVPQTLAANSRAQELTTKRIDLDPNQKVMIQVGTPGACAASTGTQRNVNTRLQLAMPGGGLKVLDGAHVDTLCGQASVLRFETVQTDVAQNVPAAATALSQLTGTVTLASTATRGQTLPYTVTLVNPTATAISLASCPSYTQSLYVNNTAFTNTYLLNCAASGVQIAAKSSVTYQMQLPLPANVPAGSAKLSWNLQYGPAVGGIIALQ